VADVRVAPVSSLVTVIVAPVSDAFEVSVTPPEILPVVDWAPARLGDKRATTTATRARAWFMLGSRTCISRSECAFPPASLSSGAASRYNGARPRLS
jgi:hypothetical protein